MQCPSTTFVCGCSVLHDVELVHANIRDLLMIIKVHIPMIPSASGNVRSCPGAPSGVHPGRHRFSRADCLDSTTMPVGRKAERVPRAVVCCREALVVSYRPF